MQRRNFLQWTGLTALELWVMGCRRSGKPGARFETPEAFAQPGPLALHPSRVLELPPGFEMTVLQSGGDLMSDGLPMPYQPDGMVCLPGEDGQWVLMRNHELSTPVVMAVWGIDLGPYSRGTVPQPWRTGTARGGVSRLVVDPVALGEDLAQGRHESRAVTSSQLILAGTDSNCAGGVVDGAWVSCEESSRDGHGYAFVTRPTDTALTAPRPIDSWGRFHREAVAVDPRTGTIYMTEDRPDGCFYRFLPESPAAPFGAGRLQALSIPGLPHTNPTPTGTGPTWQDGQSWPVTWVDVPDPAASQEPCRIQVARLGATGFYRSEGIAWGRGVWFLASTGGAIGGGQIFCYKPEEEVLVLATEVTDRSLLSCPDNLCLAPWGDLVMCEDNYQLAPGVTHQHVRGMRPDGSVYDIARNTLNTPEDAGPEFAGACFSPDGSVLFVNLQLPLHLTVAIQWPR
jgi:secreted PhoX family phosphatase